MPDSPRWLLITDKEKKGIDAINFIAWFNGSDYKVPEDATFQETLDAQKAAISKMGQDSPSNFPEVEQAKNQKRAQTFLPG